MKCESNIYGHLGQGAVAMISYVVHEVSIKQTWGQSEAGHGSKQETGQCWHRV